MVSIDQPLNFTEDTKIQISLLSHLTYNQQKLF
jgi:hypothetical protein